MALLRTANRIMVAVELLGQAGPSSPAEMCEMEIPSHPVQERKETSE